MIKEFIADAIEANREVYHLVSSELNSSYFKSCGIGKGGDISKEIDLVAENIFIATLQKYGQIFSEESGIVGSGERKIYIDPIDGSENFVSKIPYFGSSLALQEEEKVIVGVVCNYSNGDIFIKDDTSFRVAKLDKLNFTEVKNNPFSSIGIFERGYRGSKYSKRLQKEDIKYRVSGAVALSLAYAHYVDFVIFEGEMRDYDIKAGLFMCENLYKYQYNDLLLISKEKERFDELKRVILEE